MTSVCATCRHADITMQGIWTCHPEWDCVVSCTLINPDNRYVASFIGGIFDRRDCPRHEAAVLPVQVFPARTKGMRDEGYLWRDIPYPLREMMKDNTSPSALLAKHTQARGGQTTLEAFR